jgi:uncharacterized protein
MTFKMAVNCNWKPDDFKALRDQFDKLGQFYIESLLSSNPLNIDDFAKGLRAIHKTSTVSRFPCGSCRGVMLVDPRGDIWPCHRFGPHQCGGQFRLASLGGAFNNRLRNAFLNYNVVEDAKTDCHNCRASLTCRSWCYAECVDTTHTFYDPGAEYCDGMRIINESLLCVHDYLRAHHPDKLRNIINETKE